METLPDQLIWEVLHRIVSTSDRNSVSLLCKRFHQIEGDQREYLRVGCGLNPANEALTSLCIRFPNLTKVEIVYSGWMSKLGKQLGDEGLRILSGSLYSLVDLTLSFCTFITDAGLGYLGSCTALKALRLNFTPRITGCGILSLVVGCKNLSALHLTRCLNVSSGEWLEYLGRLESLEDLAIKNCRAIGEGDLTKIGLGWRRLKRLQFEVDVNYRYMKLYGCLSAERWQKQLISCEALEDLSLVNCLISPGRGLACVLGQCQSLVKLHLNMCVGLRDNDLICLSQHCRKLKSLSLRVPSDFSVPILMSNPLRLTDDSLKSIAQNCLELEEVSIAFADGDFPSLSSFTLAGILSLIEGCPIKVLALDRVYSFNDIGMEALSAAPFLEEFELIHCQEVTDEGLQLVKNFPHLTVLRLCSCLGITDIGLKPLVGSHKLQTLRVEDCPQISEKGIEGAAKNLFYRQDLSWMY
eukprot:TRINITY_DN17322_c0_g1_i1.p1 TRINITY_DN17322_c0_g1~~TRINITY_DN17322_c0_g1_i1.p1  ORF type:complete len:468 (+),score=57.69 TRINITY_DN17322_c0_g1_i1:73-1476(+)